MGLLSTFLKLLNPNPKKDVNTSEKISDDFYLDPSIRERDEALLRKEGVIGGSVLYRAQGFENAYRRIMKDVITSNSIKSELYTALAQEEGTKIYERFLLPDQWEWPEFDKWKAIFTKDGKFPYMWNKYTEICMPPFEDFELPTLLERMRVNDIKEFLNKAQVNIPPKIKKSEIIALAEQKLSVQIFCELMPEFYDRLKADHARRVNSGKCAILSHTITMLAYNLRDFYTSRVKLSILVGCSVEANYAKGRGRITEENIPPFFPGDRTGVSFITRLRH